MAANDARRRPAGVGDCGRIVDPATPTAGRYRPGNVRVASFNVRNGRAFDGWHSWPFRRRALLEAVRSLDADVVGLQEPFRFQLRWLTRRLGDHDVVGAGRNDGRRGEHTAILVRRSTGEVVEHRTRWYGDRPDHPGERLPGARVPRTATTALVQLSDGTRMQVTCTHLDERDAGRRRRSLEQLLGWLAASEHPQVLLGDFNAEVADPLLSLAAEAGFRQALAPDAGGTNHDFTGRTDGRRLDHILVGPGVAVVDSGVAHPRPGGRLPSDHWPVWADLEL
jgi:endonuclease/exonuclease/phosphatase family metal-dependent hydrolase